MLKSERKQFIPRKGFEGKICLFETLVQDLGHLNRLFVPGFG